MSYQKIKEIGKGTFGVVDLVEDGEGQRWAKKTFNVSSLVDADEDQLRKRFEREVKYQTSIDHPNIVQIHDSRLDADPPYFVMELADCTLRDELIADRTLGGQPQKALFDILNGLEAMHEAGFIHRDLKPANILKMIDEDGASTYEISDFGLMSASESESSTLTASNIQGGTVNYAAPELASDFKRGTTLSDIYSFGAILHDIYAGGASRVPYTELKVHGPLEDIISKCTKRLPQRRYQSVSLLRADLYDVLNAQEIDFTSSEEEAIVSMLQEKDKLSDDEWDRVFLLIEENNANSASSGNLFRAISIDHIFGLHDQDIGLFSALGREFCEYVYEGTFTFDYCDVLASKVQLFYDLGEIDLKALAALSLLEMGATHNRWYVEHKFMKMASSDISDALANRIKLEADVLEMNFARRVQHVEYSIGVSRKSLHLILQAMLG